MMSSITKLEELFELAQKQEKKRLVIIAANDDHSVEAAYKAVELGLVEATLVGDANKIKCICKSHNLDTDKLNIIDEPIDSLAALKSVDLIKDGKGDVLMKGMLSTDQFMRALLNKEKGMLNKGAVLSHVTVMENPSYHKLMVLSDVAIIPLPDMKQKQVLIGYLTRAAKALQIETPKIALLAPTEQVLAGLPSCSESALLTMMCNRGQIKGALVDGPLSLDIAVNKEVADLKGIDSPVAGDADCFLFPNIESGNIFYKTSTKFCKAKSAAVVMGAKVPAVLASRADSTQSKLYSIALASLIK